MHPVRRHTAFLILMLGCLTARGQFMDSASGLLQAPSAEMGETGTFMITNIWMHQQATPPAWDYNTFGYGFSIVFFPRVELGCAMTLIDARKSRQISGRDSVMFNQDRRLFGKVQLLREGEFGKSWIPALAVGVNDPTTGDVNKRSDIDLLDFDVSSGNGFFNRVYVVATKHFPTPLGTLGAHVGYQYNRRDDRRYNGPCAALDWEPVWLRKEQWLTTKLIAEYDARTFNVGMIASVWDGHFELMVDLQALRWLSAGIRFKMILQ